MLLVKITSSLSPGRLFGFHAAILCFLLASVAIPSFAQSAAKPPPKSAKPAATADLPLIDIAGYNQVLSKYRGKPLVVTFWATWCEPCRDEFPMLVELYKQYAPQGLAIFGVSLDDDADMNLVRRFLAKNQPGFPNYRQKPGIDVDAFYRSVNPAWTGTMPETIFYGRDGRIIGHFVGAQSRAAFEEGIRQALASPGAQAAGH
jgi:thiol-disulfide isomerase/thioredoxin